MATGEVYLSEDDRVLLSHPKT